MVFRLCYTVIICVLFSSCTKDLLPECNLLNTKVNVTNFQGECSQQSILVRPVIQALNANESIIIQDENNKLISGDSISSPGKYFAFSRSNEIEQCYSPPVEFNVTLKSSINPPSIIDTVLKCSNDTILITSVVDQNMICSNCEILYFNRFGLEVEANSIGEGTYTFRQKDVNSGCSSEEVSLELKSKNAAPVYKGPSIINIPCTSDSLLSSSIKIENSCIDCLPSFFSNENLTQPLEKVSAGEYKIQTENRATGCTSTLESILVSFEPNDVSTPPDIEFNNCTNRQVQDYNLESLYPILEGQKIRFFVTQDNLEAKEFFAPTSIEQGTYITAWQNEQTNCLSESSSLLIQDIECPDDLVIEIEGSTDSVSFQVNGVLYFVSLPYSFNIEALEVDSLVIEMCKLSKFGTAKIHTIYQGQSINQDLISEPFSCFYLNYQKSTSKVQTRKSNPDEWQCGYFNNRWLYEGPRGGCYYINSNNNKTYVDRSFCSCK